MGLIPNSARDSITAHWQKGNGSPHVWLLQDRKEWKGSGWAQTRNNGISICFVSFLVGKIPDEHLKTTIAHELGHILFIAGEEENHVPARNLDTLINPPDDVRRRYHCEWLVWQLMEDWNFDQTALEEWMEKNTIDNGKTLELRAMPLVESDYEGRCKKEREKVLASLNYMKFPNEFAKYMRGVH